MDPSRVVRIIIAACLCCRLPTSAAFSPACLVTLQQPAATTNTATTEAVPNGRAHSRYHRTCIASSRHIERRRRRRYCTDTELRAEEGSSSSSSSSSSRSSASTNSDRREFLKHVAGLSTLVGGLGVLAGRPAEAGAFCGEPYPYWAYYVDFDEVFVPFECEGYSGKLFVRTVGNYKEQKKAKHSPLVVIPGGPGLPHDYLETLEGASKDDRVVVLFDPIGTGNSTALPADVRSSAPGLLGTQGLVAQTNTVLDFLKLNSYHLFGHGTGAAAALELGRSMGHASPRPPGPELEAVLSVTLASPVLGGGELPPDFLETLRAPYTRGGNEAPLCLETAMQGKNDAGFTDGLSAMKQEKGSKIAAGPLACPVLITYGGRDVIGEKGVANIKEALSGGDSPVEVKLFTESGHLAHLDEREEYVTLVQNYITSIDEAWSGESKK